MALIKNVNVNDEDLSGELFVNPIAQTVLEKYRMPKESSSASVIERAIEEELMLDGNAKQNLSTFCTTWAEDEIHKLMDISLDKNMIDKDEYPQTAEIENRCIHIIADLWHSPKSGTTMGCSTTGSSEASMLGGLAMKWRWKEYREKNGLDISKPNLVCGAVQICWVKFAKYFDVELREIPLDGEEVGINVNKIKDYVDENTIGVVPTLGLTYTCVYEDVNAIAKELDRIQEEKGWDIPIHVDAASGGFIAPFIEPELTWDFKIERVKSINTSGHKYGLAPLGVGWVVWRTEEDLPKDLIFNVNYLGGNMPTFTLNFSRPGGQIISQYYNFMRLGFDGYKRVQLDCMLTAQYLADEVSKMPEFDMFYNGRGGLPAISYTLSEGDWGFNLYDLSDHMRQRGWQVASYPLPNNRKETVIQRVLIRHGFGRNLATLFIKDLKDSVEYFEKNPQLNSNTTGGFNHN